MTDETPEKRDWAGELIPPIGYALGLSYPVLALSTGVRAGYQLLFKANVENYLASWLSALAAVFYIVATVGFFVRKPWAWRLSVTMLGAETFMTLLIGTLSLIVPEVIGRTVWGRFGADYGFFPLVQPLLGLAWLFWPATRALYGVTRSRET